MTRSKFTTLKLLGATGILAAALAGPAMAQQVIYNPGYCAQFYPNANCQNKGPGNPYTGDYQRRTVYGGDGWNYGWRQSRNEARNGFVCGPGGFFRGADGLRHRCQ